MERVLDGVHKIAVADMVAEASVRKHMRDLYMRYAVVSTGISCTHHTTITNHIHLVETSTTSKGGHGFCMLLVFGSRHPLY